MPPPVLPVVLPSLSCFILQKAARGRAPWGSTSARPMAALLVYGWWGESRNVTQYSMRENVKRKRFLAQRCHAVRVVRAGLPLRPRRPSGHSREQEVGVTGRDCQRRWEVAWAEQFPRGGGLCGACYVLYMCRRAFAGEPNISIARIRQSCV